MLQQLISPIKLEAVTKSTYVLQKRLYCKLLLSVHNQKWNNLSPKNRKSVPYGVFKLTKPTPNSLFNVSDCLGIKLLTRLRLGLSHFYCLKIARIQSFKSPHFSAFELNTEKYSPYLVRTLKNTDQKNSNYRHFSRST